MITIEYSENGQAISDFNCDKYIKNIQELIFIDRHYAVSSSIVILAIRAAIARKELDHEKIRFKFNGQFLYPDKNGRIEYWPEGFCNFDLKFMDDLIFKP